MPPVAEYVPEFIDYDTRQTEVELPDGLLGNDSHTSGGLLESEQVDPWYHHSVASQRTESRHCELPAPRVSMHYAARSGNARALRVFLSDPAKPVNAVDSLGWSVLHYIVDAFTDDCFPEKASDFESCIEMLMECSRFDINIVDYNGLSALHLAANKKRNRAATAIIEKSSAAHRDLDVDRRSASGQTAREALQAEMPDVCKRLIDHSNKFPASKKRLLEAIDTGDFRLYRRLLRRAAAKDVFNVDFWFDAPYNTRLLERACRLRDQELATKFVKVTLDAGAHPSSINLCNLRTPVHVAVAAGNSSAVRLLVEHSLVDINAKDGNGQTPLHIASSCPSSEHTHDCLELLLNVYNINVNAVDNSMKTPADLVQCTNALIIIEGKGGFKRGSEMHHSQIIRQCMVAIPYTPDDGTAPDDSTVLHDDGGETISTYPRNEKKRLFDLMIQVKYEEFEKLFENMLFEENSLKCDECGYTYLQYACERGQHDFAKKLLKKVDPNGTHERNKKTPLMLACLQNDFRMVQILLNTTGIKPIEINAVDIKGNTALHYAAKRENTDIIFELLFHGADILAKNMFGNYPLSVEEVERLLDKCIEVKDDILPSNDNFVITFDYKMLITQCMSRNLLKDSNSHLIQRNPPQAESTNGKSISLGPRSHLEYSEMTFLNSLCSSSEFAALTKHPLITSFLSVKTERMRPLLLWNLILSIVFVITLNAYILVEVDKLHEKSTLFHFLQICFCVTAFICAMLMLLREICQLAFQTDLYTKNYENLFDLCLILMAGLILLHIPLGSFTPWAFIGAILLSWRDLFIETGRHYKFSTNVQMLKAVSLNYLHCLKSYIFLIFGFCLSIYVIFSRASKQSMTQSSDYQGNDTADIFNQTQTDGEGTEAINFFENPLKTLLKTVIMMTGEFDASDLPFSVNIWLTSNLFMIFLFFLHVILLNLLTALAVSDEQEIRANAEILSIISQIILLYQIENIALSLYTLFKHSQCISKHFQNLLLFSEKSIKDACLFVWPNRKKQHSKLSGEKGYLRKRLDSKIVNEAKHIVRSHGPFFLENEGEADGLSALMDRIEHIHADLKLLLQEQH